MGSQKNIVVYNIRFVYTTFLNFAYSHVRRECDYNQG